MSQPTGSDAIVPGLQRMRMSYEEWFELPAKPKSEWVDGEVIVNPPASFAHQAASFRLTTALHQALPRLVVVQDVGVKLPNNRVRVPDISVLDRAPDGFLVTESPRLVVEILSPNTRSEDTVRKSAEYAAAGIGQYWLLDPEAYALDVYQNSSGGWASVLHLDDHEPDGQVDVAGTLVPLGLADLLTVRSE